MVVVAGGGVAASPGPAAMYAAGLPIDSRAGGGLPFAPPPYLAQAAGHSHLHPGGMAEGMVPVMGPYGLYFQVRARAERERAGGKNARQLSSRGPAREPP